MPLAYVTKVYLYDLLKIVDSDIIFLAFSVS